jgi:acyl-coenzyme A synthetase/AMP-(fatty) acid ligase
MVRRKKAPQKVKPKPMKARIWDEEKIEEANDRMPIIINAVPIFPETILAVSRLGNIQSSLDNSFYFSLI